MKTQQTDPSQMTLGNASPLRPGDDRPPLPEGWVWTTIGDAYEVILGQSPPSSTYNTEGIGLPFYQGKAEFGDIFPVPVKWCSQPNKIAEAGDVLISVRAPVGPTNLCRERSCIGRGLSAIRPRDEMLNLYLFYYLRSIEQDWESKATGTTFSAINGKVLREQEIPLAPLPEQHHIVAAIETQFTRLDAAVAALERAKANLARYKASVLKAACEGRLVPTEAALYRAICRGEAAPDNIHKYTVHENAEAPGQEDIAVGLPRPDVDARRGEATPQPSTNAQIRGGAQTSDREEPGGGCLAPTDAGVGAAYEPADVLLRRILAERRARWMADNPGKRYIEPAAPDTSGPALSNAEGLPDLPEGWVWANVGSLFDVSIGGTPSRKIDEYWEGNISWVSSGEVAFCRIKGTRERITVAGLENSSAKLNPSGTVLLAMIGEGKTRGQAAILDVPAANNQNVAAILCSDTPIMPEWVFFWLMANYEQTRRGGVASGGMQPALNSQKVRALTMPLPPLAEQHRIVAEVERRLSVVAEVEASIDANLARAARLRQAILREAFAGRLVPRGDGDVGMGA